MAVASLDLSPQQEMLGDLTANFVEGGEPGDDVQCDKDGGKEKVGEGQWDDTTAILQHVAFFLAAVALGNEVGQVGVGAGLEHFGRKVAREVRLGLTLDHEVVDVHQVAARVALRVEWRAVQNNIL